MAVLTHVRQTAGSLSESPGTQPHRLVLLTELLGRDRRNEWGYWGPQLPHFIPDFALGRFLLPTF